MVDYRTNLRIENERPPIEYREIKLPEDFVKRVSCITRDEKILEYLKVERIIHSLREQNDFI